MTPDERDLLLRAANICLCVALDPGFGSSPKDIRELHQLIDSVTEERGIEPGCPKVHTPASKTNNPLRHELHQHLDIRYEVEHLETTPANNGRLYITSAMLKPRDEL